METNLKIPSIPQQIYSENIISAIQAKNLDEIREFIKNDALSTVSVRLQALEAAIDTNDINVVNEIINNKYLSDTYKFPAGKPVIFLAYERQAYDVLKELSKNKNYLNSRDNRGENLLMICIKANDMGMIESLINNPDIDLTAKSESGVSVIDLAVEAKTPQILQLALEHIHQMNKADIVMAVIKLFSRRKYDLLKTILQALIDKKYYNITSINQPLFAMALSDQQPEIAEMLLKTGCLANLDYKGQSSLYYAITNGYLELATKSVELASKIDISDPSKSVLSLALGKDYQDLAIQIVKKVMGENDDFELEVEYMETAQERKLTKFLNFATDLENKKREEEDEDEDEEKKASIEKTLNRELAQGDHNMKFTLQKNPDLNKLDKLGLTSLHYAMMAKEKEKHKKAVKKLIKRGANPCIKNARISVLEFAVLHSPPEVIDYLLEVMKDVNIQSRDGKTALIAAIERGLFDIAETLMEKGANVSLATKKGKTALIATAMKCNNSGNRAEKFFVKLASEKIDPSAHDDTGSTVLHYLAKNGAKEAFEIFLQKYPNIDLNKPNNNGETPLILALTNGRNNFVDFLLEKISIETLAVKGDNPLIPISAIHSFDSLTEQLIEHGGNPDTVDKNGCTALIYAAKANNTYIIPFLLEKGASPNVTDKTYERTPLYWAAMSNFADALKMLLEHGADAKIRAKDGTTAEKAAFFANAKDTYELLVDTNNGNKEPAIIQKNEAIELLFAAAMRNDFTQMEKILQNNISINAKNETYGQTIAYIAAMNNNVNLLNFAVNHKCDINIEANNGLTPIKIAVIKRSIDVIPILIENGATIDASSFSGRSEKPPVFCETLSSEKLQKYENMFAAATRSDIESVSHFLDDGLDIDFHESQNGRTLCFIAATKNDVKLLSFLISKKCDFDAPSLDGISPLESALISKSAEAAVALLKCGAKVDIDALSHNIPPVFSYDKEELETDIFEAQVRNLLQFAKGNQIDQIDQAVKTISVNARDPHSGKTMCYIAARENNASLLRHLISLGADINIPTKSGITPFIVACSSGMTDALSVLIEHNAKADTPVAGHLYPIHFVCLNNTLDAVKMVLKHTNMLVNCCDSNGNTPLHLLIMSTTKYDIGYWLIHNTDIEFDKPNAFGETPLILAIRFKRKELAIALVEKGARLDVTDSEGNTPLHVAVISGSSFLLNYILMKKPPISIRNNSGLSPFLLSVKCGKKKIIDIVKEKTYDSVELNIYEQMIKENSDIAQNKMENIDFYQVLYKTVQKMRKKHFRRYNFEEMSKILLDQLH